MSQSIGRLEDSVKELEQAAVKRSVRKALRPVKKELRKRKREGRKSKRQTARIKRTIEKIQKKELCQLKMDVSAESETEAANTIDLAVTTSPKTKLKLTEREVLLIQDYSHAELDELGGRLIRILQSTHSARLEIQNQMYTLLLYRKAISLVELNEESETGIVSWALSIHPHDKNAPSGVSKGPAFYCQGSYQ